MTRDFTSLASALKKEWSDDGERAYTEASEAYAREIASRREVGLAVASLREELGITQIALARISSVHQSEISRIERGRGNPTVDTLNRLAQAMGRRLTFEPVDS